MRTIALLLAASAATLMPAAAYAQEEDEDPVITAPVPGPAAKETGIAPSLIGLVAAAAPESGTGVLLKNYALSASTDDNVLSVTIAPVTPQFNGKAESAFNLTFKVPLGATLGGEADTTVSDQGLPDKFSGTVSYSRIWTNFGPRPDEHHDFQAFYSQCTNFWNLHKETRPAVVATFCDGGGVMGLTLADFRTIAGGDAAANAAIVGLQHYQNRKHNAQLYILNLSGSVGARDYSSLNPADFSDRKAERTSFAINASGGISFGKQGLFIGVGYQYRRDYSDPEKRVVCPAGSTTGCRSEIFDLPKPDIDHTAFALARFSAPALVNGIPPVIEVKVSYDFQDKLWGVQVPIYFVTGDDGALRGGVRFTYESRGNDPNKRTTSFGVFMVKSFDRLGL